MLKNYRINVILYYFILLQRLIKQYYKGFMLQSQKNHKKEDQFEFFFENLKKTKIINKVDSFFEGGKFKGYTFYDVF